MNPWRFLALQLAITVVGLALIFGGYFAGYSEGAYNGCVRAGGLPHCGEWWP